MFCEAKAASLDALPSNGETFTLKQELEKSLGTTATIVHNATLSRLGDALSRPRFLIHIDFEYQDGSRQRTNLLHVPSSESNNDTYDGHLWASLESSATDASTLPKDQYVRLNYSKHLVDGSAHSTARIISAKYRRDFSALAFDHLGRLDVNASTDTKGRFLNPETSVTEISSANVISSVKVLDFSYDIGNETGQSTYWFDPSSDFDGSVSGISIKSEVDSDGVFRACGLLGIGHDSDVSPLSLRRALKEESHLEIKGFYHPNLQTDNLGSCLLHGDSGTDDETGTIVKKTCGDNVYQWYIPKTENTDLSQTFATKTRGDVVQRQCFYRTDSGTYNLDTTAITDSNGYELLESSQMEDKKNPLPDVSLLKNFEIR